MQLGWTYVFQIANFIVLFLLLRRWFWKPVAAYLERRRQHVESLLRDAERARVEAEQSRKDYEERIREAVREAQEIVDRAKDYARDLTAQLTEEARREADRIVQAARAEIQREKERAAREMSDQVVDLTLEVARKVLRREVHPHDHARMVDEFVSRIAGGARS